MQGKCALPAVLLVKLKVNEILRLDGRDKRLLEYLTRHKRTRGRAAADEFSRSHCCYRKT
jgi:hypothetical protein